MSIFSALIICASAASPAQAQRVVSLDDETLVVTDLKTGRGMRIALGTGPFISIAANGTSAYALSLHSGRTVVQVDLASGAVREFLRPPCCSYVIAVDADDRTLYLGGEELDQGSVTAYDIKSARARFEVLVTGRPNRIQIEGDRATVFSATSPLADRFYLSTLAGGDVTAEYEVPGAEAGAVYLSASDNADHASGSGCSIAVPDTRLWQLAVGLLVLVLLRRSARRAPSRNVSASAFMRTMMLGMFDPGASERVRAGLYTLRPPLISVGMSAMRSCSPSR